MALPWCNPLLWARLSLSPSPLSHGLLYSSLNTSGTSPTVGADRSIPSAKNTCPSESSLAFLFSSFLVASVTVWVRLTRLSAAVGAQSGCCSPSLLLGGGTYCFEPAAPFACLLHVLWSFYLCSVRGLYSVHQCILSNEKQCLEHNRCLGSFCPIMTLFFHK